MTEYRFFLALEKIEVVILIIERIPTFLPMKVVKITLEFKPTEDYLAIMVDSNTSFFEQNRDTAD